MVGRRDVFVALNGFSLLSCASRAPIASKSTLSPGSTMCSRMVAIADIWEKRRTMWHTNGSDVRSHSALRDRSKLMTCPHASAHFECMFFTIVTPSQ